ncbi:uncharacterized protein Dwil_GK20231 [Drosophila willistoni]|uniref:SWIM-type domain-containing protein n=1 Tax=Drosophila willistoni TaxID=7260 RepID=B4MXL4_DROWI|nr:uncharacterized protein LOC6643206 [Drosophila willistoni]EDW76783.1 uncharacterized protein Dwil_GK20231 [Drosophila willistoni]
MAKKPFNFKEMPSEVPPPPPQRGIKLDNEKQTVAEALNFMKISCERPPQERKPKIQTEQGPTVADELNARLGMVHVRSDHAKRIKRLVKWPVQEQQAMYKFYCVCPRYHPCYVPCQHTGQIIIDRDVLSREEHICFLATPKKDLSSQQVHKPPKYFTKKIYVPTCTARVERLADPHPQRVKDTYKNYRNLLSPRQVTALQNQMKPKPPVEVMTMDKAMEYLEEEQRLRRVAKQLHRRRCKSLKKRILLRQRKQMQKIVCVLFEEMKDFLLNDQFIIDENSPLCAVILERIKDFTDQEFYTTSNLREYQRILANNLTVWINKFISNLNIYLAPQQLPVQRPIMHQEDPEQFVPLSDYISMSEGMEEEMQEDYDQGLQEYEDYDMFPDEGEYLPDILAGGDGVPSEETLIN